MITKSVNLHKPHVSEHNVKLANAHALLQLYNIQFRYIDIVDVLKNVSTRSRKNIININFNIAIGDIAIR